MLGLAVPVDAFLVALGPLQGGAEGIAVSTQALLTGYELVGAVLGVFIAYQAYRGYRRNDSRPMLFISLGFILIFAGGVGVLTVFLLVPSIPEAGIQVLNQTVEIAGLLCIIYALRVEV